MDDSARPRTLMLLGGNEWRPGSEVADAWWLARAARPKVTVLTSAAQDIPDTQVSWAATYFAGLGAEVEGCRIQSRQEAADSRFLDQLLGAAAIYLCGGDPAAAQQVLVDTPAAQALWAAYRSGIPIAGSSAGAMVLSEACLFPGRAFSLKEGLGFFGPVVVPHWSTSRRSWSETVTRVALEREVLAIDESTGVCWDGHAWEVRGPGRAVLVTPTGEAGVGVDRPAAPVE